MFEPEGEEEHAEEYSKIHEDYKNLVTCQLVILIEIHQWF